MAYTELRVVVGISVRHRIGNGLRNRLAEALAKGDNALGKIYVSTTYFCMTVIISIIYLLFLVAQNWLDWYEILNVEADKVERL